MIRPGLAQGEVVNYPGLAQRVCIVPALHRGKPFLARLLFPPGKFTHLALQEEGFDDDFLQAARAGGIFHPGTGIDTFLATTTLRKMGNKPSMEDELINLKMTSRQMTSAVGIPLTYSLLSRHHSARSRRPLLDEF